MRRIAVALLFVVLAGCGDDGKESIEPPAARTSTTSAFALTDVSTPENSEQGELTKVTVGDHGGFVRVVFTFANLVPGYSVKKASPPFTQDGSGNTVNVVGDAHLAVRLTARAHDDDGNSVFPGVQAGPKGGSVTQITQIGDFEGVVNFVIGLHQPSGFKVFTLSSPHRLVVDIESP